MSFTRFLFTRTMARHIGLVLLAGIVLAWLILMLLRVYTKHGDEFEMPDFTDLYPDEIVNQDKADMLRFEIIDTIYSDQHERGTISSQSPPAGSKVKPGRRVFLTLVSDEPEKVAMPNVMNITLRLASATLESYGLRVGMKEYVPSEFKDAVLDQKFHGMHIEPGTPVLKGSVIDLDIGQGLGSERIAVPNLLGLKKSEVHKLLAETSLNIGSEVFDDSDTSVVRVYRQSPGPSYEPYLHRGASIDLWYRSGTNEEFEALRRESVPDTLPSGNNEEWQ